MFRVDACSGTRYALRISRRGVRDRLAIQSELIWMAALARDADVVVPDPVPLLEGGFVAELPNLDTPRIRANLPQLIQGIEDQLRSLSGTE